MSIIRRPAAISHTFIDANIQPEEVTRLLHFKVKSLKTFFQESYEELESNTAKRTRRQHDLMRLFLENQNMPDSEKDEITANFVKEENAMIRKLRTKLKAQQYERIKMIGRGKLSDVWLALDKTTSEIVVLKVIPKHLIIYYGLANQVRCQRDIFVQSDSPWIADLICSFQDPDNLYYVVEYLPGGDLRNRLSTIHTFPEEQVVFYIGEILLALNSVHELGYIHQNLTPANVLISSTGHIKLSNFACSDNYANPEKVELSAYLDQLTLLMEDQAEEDSLPLQIQTIGRPKLPLTLTLSYMPPEFLPNSFHRSISGDFWNLGIIMYELLYGIRPFPIRNVKQYNQVVLNWPQYLRFPPNPNVSRNAIDLMSHLICYQDDRYGYVDIITHPFFEAFNFDEPDANEPPYIPQLSSPVDTSHFQDEFRPNPDQNILIPHKGIVEDYAFLGFTYKNTRQNKTLSKLKEKQNE